MTETCLCGNYERLDVILRLWRGWTAPERTRAYEQLLTELIAPGILDRGIPGLRDLTVLRRLSLDLDPRDGGETLTAMTFDDLDAVAAFAGADLSASVVPPDARRLLTSFDEHSQHYTALATFTRHQ